MTLSKEKKRYCQTGSFKLKFSAVPGKGVQCSINNKIVLIRNRSLMNENGVNIPLEAENFLIDLELNDSSFVGLMGITYPLKREAAVAVEGLKKMAVHPVMLTGDKWRTAQAVAKEVGIEDVRAEVMPAGKAYIVRSLQKDGTIVAMVGDGINDSLALVAADVSMAIGGGRTSPSRLRTTRWLYTYVHIGSVPALFYNWPRKTL